MRFFRNRELEKYLRRENGRLRRDIRERDKTIQELLDSFVFHKRPARLAGPASSTPTAAVSTHQTTYPADSYSAIINELEQQVDQVEANDLSYYIDNDDQVS